MWVQVRKEEYQLNLKRGTVNTLLIVYLKAVTRSPFALLNVKSGAPFFHSQIKIGSAVATEAVKPLIFVHFYTPPGPHQIRRTSPAGLLHDRHEKICENFQTGQWFIFEDLI
jgi:hypothetical protein